MWLLFFISVCVSVFVCVGLFPFSVCCFCGAFTLVIQHFGRFTALCCCFFPPLLPLLTSPLVYLIHQLGTNTSTLRPLPPAALIPRLFQMENGLQGLSRKSLCLNLYEWEPCEPCELQKWNIGVKQKRLQCKFIFC